jgi:MazG family protein
VKDSTEAIDTLLATVRRLLGPEGCPWDRKQTVQSLAPHAVEEAWEFFDAVKSGMNPAMREELGDLLMLIFLTGELAAREERFTLCEAAAEVTAKLIRRHPHVFGALTVEDPEQVKKNWEAIKKREGKGAADDGLPRVPASLPALSQAFKLGKAAGKRGFDWPDWGGPLAKISEEWGELKNAVARGDPQSVEQEVGDLLFAVTNLCRTTGTDPEAALRSACARFRRRFGRIVREDAFSSLARMESVWEKAKDEENHEGP